MNVSMSIEGEKVGLTTHPFKLLKNIDFSGLSASLNIVGTGADGGLFLNSRYNTRDIEMEGMIDVTGKDEGWLKRQKEILYRICNPKEQVTLEIEENGETYYINAHPVSFPIFLNNKANKNKSFQTFMIQMVASDPYLYTDKRVVTFSSVTPTFSFPLEMNEIVMGEKKTTLIESIWNDGMMDCPIEIVMRALQSVTNPYLVEVYTQKKIQLNTTLDEGDIVVINTGRKKEISRYRDGVKENFFWSLDLENSAFISLRRGDNVFRFGADFNQDFLEIEIRYQQRMGGI
ncbi:phage tail family protein [Peribacillus frigoritolerans]|uniref:phage distal tail protein n=1 Tax=Peribacillus frigoritolerans TaxID=450367 RepID=UPI00207A8444|nr:phage tail domain-containing protein [Peribacillus frigoritolerans]USK78955.1 phage tail family protein [Peribacillus frigoritolerans]